MKKFFAVLFIAALLCLTFIGCTYKPENGSGGGNHETESGEEVSNPQNPEQEEITKMYLTINGNKLEVTLAENTAVDALIEILKKGDIVYTADDYGGWEKVGSLGYDLPTSDSHITAQAGDVILYCGNQIVLFYGSNSWSYTRLGKINGYSADQLSTLLCAGENGVQITISLK